MPEFDAVVVGAGLSGAVMAERMASERDWRVLVLEKRDHVAGNCHDYVDEHGIRVHRYGPHLFHTRHERVWEYLSRFTDWHHYEHRVLGAVDGMLAPIPFNLASLDQFYPDAEAAALRQLLIDQYGRNARVPILELRQSASAPLRQLAELIYAKFFVNYTCKQWGCRPEDIASEVTARVPVVVSEDDRYFQDEHQALPVGGYTRLVEALLDHANITVETGVDALSRIRPDRDSGSIGFDGRRFDGWLIYTGMLDELFGFAHGELEYRSLRFQFEHHPVEAYQPATTVNYPNDHDYTRITEFRHLMPEGEKVRARGTTIVKEYPQAYDRSDVDCDVPYYPMFNDANLERYRVYAQLAAAFRHLMPLGRLADYRYYNMDDAVNNALLRSEELE